MSKKEKFIPMEKQSKKNRREFNAQKRNDWGELNPVTRREEKNAYKRKKQREREDSMWYE